MRTRLVVAVVIGSILLLQVPAEAVHLYMRIKPRGNKTDVVTNCKVGQTLEVSSGGVVETATVPEGSDPDGDGVYEFTTAKVNRVARGGGAIKATRTSDDHTIIVELAETGITTTQELVVGVGLVSIGVLLLLYGRRPPAGRRPRRRRPPVKVYAQ